MKSAKDKLPADLQKLLADHLKSGKPLLGQDSPISQLMQSAINAVLEGELDHHLAEEAAAEEKNKRNGSMTKRVLSSAGELEISTPRDRNGTFQPELVAKRQTELNSGLNDQIIALYAQGNSVEDIRRLIQQMFGVEISAGKISAITDQVLPLVQQWRNRPLQAFYAIVYLDAIHFKVRHEGKYETRAFYTVYSIDLDGRRDILGLYLSKSESATEWGLVMEDLKSRGVEDVVVICTDNLSGFSQAIDQAFPEAVVQKCIVHQVRNSVRYLADKERKKVCADLRTIYTAINETEAKMALEALYQKWDNKLHYILDDWQDKWEELMAFMQFPKGMRRMIYTTNPVEAVHRIMRKLIKGKAAWTSEMALLKQLYLSLMHNQKSWKRNAYKWKPIVHELIRTYGARIEKHLIN
ncbi:IS256 family transposase [Lewinella sp. W8]|uniref:IS256 family transposase n=1 Tax=Lewinella sp. W8 TaxID=2528208 RepID=UPI001067FB08|nr:IS256 family transposase [Lewinella sp. W8]MTB54005.1 IS256 family transposase [Lewinella sp. W8]